MDDGQLGRKGMFSIITREKVKRVYWKRCMPSRSKECNISNLSFFNPQRKLGPQPCGRRGDERRGDTAAWRAGPKTVGAVLPRLVWHSLGLLAFSAQPPLARGAADFEASVLRTTVEALERSGALPPAEAALLVLALVGQLWLHRRALLQAARRAVRVARLFGGEGGAADGGAADAEADGGEGDGGGGGGGGGGGRRGWG